MNGFGVRSTRRGGDVVVEPYDLAEAAPDDIPLVWDGMGMRFTGH
ncbi:hypothetical protein PC129_g19617 [Phytophthora cactorum]|uniref:Uncharacterized protein n=1 Tax=Phytophthora cactorum TaxID=29920 RepID=A0A8T1BBA2_9STRA|nr:hypothetical protein PC112_g19435 [Phytophthora cactorum]KAG2803574.1 hypothetical protein PC111_g18625 [Phytophthora cactorum]KAG2882248.1 hypothetical protein PC114_g21128 [Phytophthora cactorum]KAG2892458.1 hypothetical protein PC115_g18809 [Phytophthora cactorum]KAG2898541.1 hypothetical protein PC117_g22488 [Phytophthora cactorum]